MAKYNAQGQEVPDKTPIALPVGYSAPEPLEQMIARLVRAESSRAHQQGKETFEEADDLELDDEPELNSPHQFTDMQEETLDFPIAPPAKAQAPKSAPLPAEVVEPKPTANPAEQQAKA